MSSRPSEQRPHPDYAMFDTFARRDSSPSVSELLNLSRLHLHQIVRVDSHEYAPCFACRDSPLYDSFGDVVHQLRGNTIYLSTLSESPLYDLFHELGHFVAKYFNLIAQPGQPPGSWERSNSRLVAQVEYGRHWSGYLNQFARQQPDFSFNAASELWAELFMLRHLHPHAEEVKLIEDALAKIQSTKAMHAITSLANAVRR